MTIAGRLIDVDESPGLAPDIARVTGSEGADATPVASAVTPFDGDQVEEGLKLRSWHHRHDRLVFHHHPAEQLPHQPAHWFGKLIRALLGVS